MNIYVGNLAYRANDEQVKALFQPYGPVNKVTIIVDRETGRSRGFAFVVMDEGGAESAIEEINGSEFQGRTLKVNQARPKPEKSHSSGQFHQKGRS
jgi:RNA recognition motif-containing protein